jgi:hypothetical protein
VWRGETAFVKIWVKTRKIVGSATLLFRLRSSFYTSRGGGSEAPIRRMARWGFIKINFNPRVCFAITFPHSSYGPSYVKQILDGVKNLNDSTANDTTIFHLYSKAAGHSVVL